MDEDSGLERLSAMTKVFKAVLVNPMINYIVPRGMLRRFLYNSGSPMAQASIDDPGGWRSMVIAYDNPEPVNRVDGMVMRLGSFPMGLRNRKRLSVKILSGLLDEREGRINIVAIGAGAAHNVLESMGRTSQKDVHAYCIDLNAEAFGHGREQAAGLGLETRVRFIHGNAVDVHELIDVAPDLVTCIGIIEYLTDEQIVDIYKAMHAVAPEDGLLLTNSIANTHGTDRFLRTVFNLQLRYRSPEHVADLMEKGGFRPFIDESEPMGIYHILVGRKEP